VADPVLACQDFSRTFILQTGASDYGIGEILTQDTKKGARVISYSSRTLNCAEKNYLTTEKECLAILAEMGINQQFTSPYTPQENPTDRANKTVKTREIGREVAGDYASSEHEHIRIHRPYTGVSYPG